MRIHVPPSRRAYAGITVNLASLIDVSFLLLFYFMVATMMDDRESRLSAGLRTQSPEAANAPGDFQSQTIEVRRGESSPVYVLGSHVCRTRQELTKALEPLPRDIGVLVKVYDGVDVGFAVAAIQASHDAGFNQVTYVPGTS
jgi:biopolymer transport protein ExbD